MAPEKQEVLWEKLVELKETPGQVEKHQKKGENLKKPVRFRKRRCRVTGTGSGPDPAVGNEAIRFGSCFPHSRRRSAWKCRESVLKSMNRPERMLSNIPCLPCASFVRRLVRCGKILPGHRPHRHEEEH